MIRILGQRFYGNVQHKYIPSVQGTLVVLHRVLHPDLSLNHNAPRICKMLHSIYNQVISLATCPSHDRHLRQTKHFLTHIEFFSNILMTFAEYCSFGGFFKKQLRIITRSIRPIVRYIIIMTMQRPARQFIILLYFIYFLSRDL